MSQIFVLILLLFLSGCKPNITVVDFAELTHAVWTDVRVWWRHMQQPVIARIDGHRITTSDMAEAYKNYSVGRPKWLAAPKGRQTLLEGVIINALPEVVAEKAGLDQDPTYQQKLARAKRELLARFLQERFRAIKPITEEEIKAQYKADADDWARTSSTKTPPPYEAMRDEIRRQIAYTPWNQQLLKMRSSFPIVVDTGAVESLPFPPESGPERRE